MKKIFCVIFLCFIAGCMGPTDYFNPRLNAIKAEGQLLNGQLAAINKEITTYNQMDKHFQQRQTEFIRKLTLEELVAYERLCSTPVDNIPKTELNLRLLLDLLSEENTTELWGFFQEAAEFAEHGKLLRQKIKVYNERLARHHQNVQLAMEFVQQKQINQQYMQNYNNQLRSYNQQREVHVIQTPQIRTNNFGQIIDNVGRTLPYSY